MKTLIFLSGNAKKTRQIEAMLSGLALKIQQLAIDTLEVQSLDIGEVSRAKLTAALEHEAVLKSSADYLLVDDTALSFDALNGLPGTLIKFFFERLGTTGLYELTQGKDTAATASCVLSLWIVKEQRIEQFIGEVPGRIIAPQPGERFGFDPIFVPNSTDRPLSQLSLEEKETHSHRGKAAAALRHYLHQSGRD